MFPTFRWNNRYVTYVRDSLIGYLRDKAIVEEMIIDGSKGNAYHEGRRDALLEIAGELEELNSKEAVDGSH